MKGLFLPLILFLLIPVFAADSAVITETVTYKRVGDLAIQADIHRRPSVTAQPVLVWIHPGALIMGSRTMLLPDARDRFVRAGFIVAAIDYRLAPETKLPDILRDIDDAFAWVRAHAAEFGGDPARVVAVGASGGAYLALMAGSSVQPALKAIASFYGYGEIVGSWYTRPSPFYLSAPHVSASDAGRAIGHKEITQGSVRDRNAFYVYCRQTGRWPREVTGLDPERDVDRFSAFSAEAQVGPRYPATILLHGDHDVDVPFELSDRLSRLLARHGVDHQYILLPGLNHAFDVFSSYPPQGPPTGLTDPKVSSAFDTAVAFLARHAGLDTNGPGKND